jgi:hypothetical protein
LVVAGDGVGGRRSASGGSRREDGVGVGAAT